MEKFPSFLNAVEESLASEDDVSEKRFFDRLFEKNKGAIGEFCSFDPGIYEMAKVVAYSAAGGKQLAPYLSTGDGVPVIYCDARMNRDSAMRQWAAIHARNTKPETFAKVDLNLKTLFMRDHGQDSTGFMVDEGRELLMSTLGANPGLLVLDDVFFNKVSPNDPYCTWGQMQSSINMLLDRNWVVLALRNLSHKNSGKGFEEYLQSLSFRITASPAKRASAQGETCLCLTHQLMHDYDPTLVGSYEWRSWREDGKCMFAIDPCADPVSVRNAEILALLAEGKTMTYVATTFHMNKSSISRIANQKKKK